MFKQKYFLLLLLSTILILPLSGCGPQSPNAAPTRDTSAETAVDQSREIVFAASRDQCPGEKDAYYASMSLGIWEPLVTKDKEGNPAPALASSWEHNEDSTQWTFHLRPDVTFSNGTAFNADVVLANFDRMKKGPFDSSFYGLNIDTIYPTLVSYEKKDDSTLILTFSEGQPLLDYTMVNYGSPIFEPSCFAEDGTFAGMPIGTGPFVVSENVLGQYCVIQRNDNYWNSPALAQTIRFKVIPDPETRYAALRSGEVQGLCDLGAISPAQAKEISSDPSYNVSVGDSAITHFLNVNGGAFPFDDVRMREGLSLMMDRSLMIESFYNGYGLPAGGFLNYTSPFYAEQPVVHDPEKGAALIREVVGDQPVSLRFLLPSVDVKRYPYQEQAEYLQSLLQNIEGTNITVSIEQMDWGPCKEEMKAGRYNLCLKIQGLPSANPLPLFKGFLSSEGSTNQNYGLHYYNPHVDQLINEAENASDAQQLGQTFTELQKISAQEFPTIPVMYSQEVVASSSAIDGYQATMVGLTGYTQTHWVK